MRSGATEPATGARAPRSHAFVVRGLAVLIGTLFGLLLAELAVRGFAWVSPAGRRLAARDPLAMVYGPYGAFGYRPRPGKIERFANGTSTRYNAMGYRGPLVRIQKQPGVYRVVLLGGSTAAGYGANDDQTIDAHLRRILAARFQGACFEVVNLAVGGYDSYQDYERMRVDGSRLAPDVVVIHSGINDVRNAQYAELSSPPDRRTLLWESALEEIRKEGGPSLWTLAKHYLYVLRLPGYVMELRGQRRTIAVTRVSEAYDSALEYFETNVERTIDVAVGVGAAVILSTPPSALSLRNKPTDPVEKSYWIRDAGTTETYRRRLEARLQEIARRRSAAGRRVSFVSYKIPVEQFLDDAHLLGTGNETVARTLAEAILPYLRQTLPVTSAANHECPR